MESPEAAGNPEESLCRIGNFAHEFGLNPKTLRYYEEIGLLPPPRRTAAGHRMYGHTHWRCLDAVLRMKAMGFSLDEIGSVIALWRNGKRPCPRVTDLVTTHLARVEDEIRRLKTLRDRLEALRGEVADLWGGSNAVCGIVERFGNAT